MDGRVYRRDDGDRRGGGLLMVFAAENGERTAAKSLFRWAIRFIA